jgi:hypothetical protein
VLRVLQEVPGNLPQLYDRMISLIKREKWDAETCYSILAVTTLSHRLLYLLKLQTLAGLGTQTIDKMLNLIHMCSSFLTVLKDHVYLIY